MVINSVTIGGLPTYDPPIPVPGLGSFVMRTGASRFGKGCFGMLRRDYDQLVIDTARLGGRTTLEMQGNPGPGLTLSVILAIAEPIITQTGADATLDLMKVTVYDRRCQNFTPLKKFYNVTQDGYPLDNTNKPICFPSTLNSGDPYGWDDILAVLLGSSENVPNSVPTWTPYNLMWDNVPTCRAVDDVAAQLFYVVGFDHQSGSVADSLALFPPYLSALGTETQDTGFGSNFDLLTQIDQKGALLSGALPGTSKATERNYNRLPGAIAVTFPGIGDGDPYETSRRVYSSTQNTGFGLSDYTITLNVGTMFGVWNGSAWVNQTDLDNVATDLAARAAQFISQAFGQAEYAGIWPFKPDGRIRQVEWVSDSQGARTIISTDNARDWLPSDSINDPINLPSNQESIGLGSVSTSIGPGGASYIGNSAPVALLKYLANATKPGMYTAYIYGPPTTQPDPTDAANLTDADVGQSSGIQVYMENVRETGAGTHILSSGGKPILFLGTFRGVAPDGKAIYAIDACQS